jgi:hypothetical protein
MFSFPRLRQDRLFFAEPLYCPALHDSLLSTEPFYFVASQCFLMARTSFDLKCDNFQFKRRRNAEIKFSEAVNA